MEIKRSGSQRSCKGPAEYFTGTVRIDPLFQPNEPARALGAGVTFEPGARTAWHAHPLGQHLIVTAGCGLAQCWGGPIEEIRPGDVIWFPPGEKHWHGATATTAMTHVAIQEQLDGKTADWMERVSDEQYRPPNGRVDGNGMKIGILGSGLMGGKLGTIFARAGHEVVFSYARSGQKLKKLAREAQGNARAGTPDEAARGADAVLLAVHWSRVDDVLRQAGDLSGKVIATCSLPMNAEDTELVLARTSSGAEELSKKVPRAHVVAAFGTVPSEVLFHVFETKRKAKRPSLLYCGDDEGAKKLTAGLIRDTGFEPEDAGPLRIARYMEPFTLLIAQLAYEGARGPELAYRFERFG